MKRILLSLLALPLVLGAQEPPAGTPPKPGPVVVHSVHYTGALSEQKASFTAALSLECTNQVETVLPLFTGDIAVTAKQLPEGLRLARSGKGYLLSVTKPGEYDVELDILAKIKKTDPLRQVEFTGPAATIGGIDAAVAGNGLELELLSGTAKPRADGDKSKVSGALGADRKVALRWQAKVVVVERNVLMTVQTVSTVQVTPTVIKYTSVYSYDILQGKPTNVVLRFPAGQAVTSVKSAAAIRDRREEVQGGEKVLTIDFIKPLEKKYSLTLLTEQPRAAAQANAAVAPPAPQGVQRERGQVNLKALDMKVEPGKPTGMTQVNAAADTIGAWQFFGRDNFGLSIALQNIDPELSAHDVVTASVEEKSLQIVHALTVKVEKAGIYSLTLVRQPGMMVTEVSGQGISDWTENGDNIEVEFAARVLGQRKVTVVLEEMADALPETVSIAPLALTGAQRQTAQVAVQPARGLELKADADNTSGLREAAARRGLAYTAAAAGWSLAVAPRQLPARVVAEVSNGVVIGDNRVYGFSKIFYAISDQGVQEFHVRLPAAWENVQFLGTRKRRELIETAHPDTNSTDYTLTLQDAAWDQYTLQVTYDLQLDDGQTTKLNLRGAHPMRKESDALLPLERDTGTVVISSVDSVKVNETNKAELTRVDQAELEGHVRGRMNTTIQYAYRYTQPGAFALGLEVQRKDEKNLINAVSDFAELTTVVTGIGQVATTATLSVKKTDKENPKFKLPSGTNAKFISCRIDGLTMKPGEEKGEEGETVYIIPLPKEASRSQVFQVQISYSETHERFKHDAWLQKLTSGQLTLSGPVTLNIPSTYSQWNVYVPATHELYSFDGNMVAPPENRPYTLATAWWRFNRSLRYVDWEATIVAGLVLISLLAILLVYLHAGRTKALITSGAFAGVLVLGVAATFIFTSMGSKRGYATAESTKYEQHTGGRNYADHAGNDRPEEESKSAREFGFTSGRGDDTNVPARQPSLQTKTKAEPRPKKTGSPLPNESPGKSSVPKTPTTPGGAGTPDTSPNSGMDPSKFGEGRGGRSPSAGPGDTSTVTGVLPPEFHISTDREPDYVFTKALNLAGKDEPLRIEAAIMDRQSRRTRAGILQWIIALAGLGLLVHQALRKERCSIYITVGVALLLGGIGAFMLSQGTLHLLYLNALWIVALAVFVWATWYFWPAQRYVPPVDDDGDDSGETPDEPDTPDATDEGSAAPAAGAAALVLLLIVQTATAGVPAPPPPAGNLTGLENLLRRLLDPEALPQEPGGPRTIRESQLQDRNGTWFEINREAPFTGRVVGFFQNRQKRIESNYNAGQLHGAQTLWFDNGQKQQVTPHQKGKRHGLETTWYRGGQRASETTYRVGQRHGPRRAWHANGKSAEASGWAAGELHGVARHFHANGKLAREVRWENGRQLAFDTWTAKGVRVGEGTNTVSMVSASYKLIVHRAVAQVDAEFKLEARAAKQKFTLFREVIAVDDFTCSQAGAKLLREGPALVLFLPETGVAQVKMRFLAKHAGDGSRRTLGFGIPSALTSNVDVVLQDADSEVEMPTAVTFNATSGGNQTLVEAVIGASDRLELAWKPRAQKAKEIMATVFLQNASNVSFGNGVVQVRTVLDYTVAQGEINTVQVNLPAEKLGEAYAWTLMKVEGGKQMRNYFEKLEGAARILTVQLDKPVAANYQLILELERTLPAPPSGANDPALNVPLVLPTAADGTVNRETGFIALQSGDELDVSPQTALMKVDAAEFTRRTKQAIVAGAVAFGYTTPDYTLAAGVKTILPEIEATARHLTAISDEQLRVTTHVAYNIKRVGVFQFKLLLPADNTLRVAQVTGPGNPQWEEKTVDGTRQLIVTLKQRTKGAYQLRVDLVKPVDSLPAQVTAEGAHPVHPLENIELKKLTHLVGIYAEAGVVVTKEGDSQSLAEMPAARLSAAIAVANPPAQQVAVPGIPDDANALAYKYIDATPDADREWSVSVTTKALESWVRNAQVVNWVKIGNSRLTGRTRIRYEVERASARRFTVMLPPNLNTNHLSFTGAKRRVGSKTPVADKIRSHEIIATPLGNLATIILQEKVRPKEEYLLTLDWEISGWSIGKDGATLNFKGPIAQGKNLRTPLDPAAFATAGMDGLVEGEEGWLVVSDDDRANLTLAPPADVAGWEKKNTGELPDWARDARSENARLVYYYFRPGHGFDLGVKKLRDAEVEKAWISQANFTSVITDDGQMLTRMTLDVNNRAKATLGITLPGEKADILSVFVNGQAVRPTQAGNQFEVALAYSSEVGNFPVEVVYSSRVNFPKRRQRVEVETPKFDVKLNNARWWVYLPREYRYSDFTGSMDPTNAREQVRRITSLDTNNDGRLDQAELGRDAQVNKLFGADNDSVDLSRVHTVNPTAGSAYRYNKGKYRGQQAGNTKIAIDNLEKAQEAAESNLDKKNLGAVNRYNAQSLKTINSIAANTRGPGNEADQRRIMDLQSRQKTLATNQRDQQVQEEQYAQQAFTIRNNADPFGGGGMGGGMGQGQGQGQGGQQKPQLFASTEETERAGRQIDELNRLQKRVTTGEVTPLNINLPLEGVFLAFSQPLQTETGEAMTISFDAENTRRTNWWGTAAWTLLALAGLFFLVNAIRHVALAKPKPVETDKTASE